MAMKIVDLPKKKTVIFHSYVNVYQRVSTKPPNLDIIVFSTLNKKAFCSEQVPFGKPWQVGIPVLNRGITEVSTVKARNTSYKY